jgi:serine protease Do
VIDQLLTNGTVTRGYLGVQMRSLSPEVASRLGLKENEGILVAKVMKDGPAAKAGIEDGDVVTALDGKPIGMPSDLSFAVAKLTSGKHIALTVLRDGKSLTIDITIGQQPAQFGAAEPRANDAAPKAESSQLEKLGFSVADLTKNSAERFGFSQSTEGAVVTEVDDGGLAANAGLRAGHLIVKVDGKQVNSAKAVKDAVAAGSLQKGVLMQVRSTNEGVSFVLVRETNE